jgi:hypothetical protein
MSRVARLRGAQVPGPTPFCLGMTGPTPPISPDGAYWWDGQAWQPMPIASQAVLLQQPAAPERPSWLAESAEVPEAPGAAPPPVYSGTPVGTPWNGNVPSPAPGASGPAWMAPAPAATSRTWAILAIGVALVLIVVGGGAYAMTHLGSQNSPGGSAAATAPPADAPSPSLAPVATQPLTGQMGGEYCPVAHPNDTACWKGSLINTGPAIGKLALMFVTAGGFSDWFPNHANSALSGFYTTPGCSIDAAHSQMLCGSLASGGHMSVYLMGDVTTRGTFRYAVKFADIASGSPVYVNQQSNGTHEIVSWVEVIT